MGKFLGSVVVAGGAGGLVGWVYAETIGQSLGLGTAWAVGASIVLGGGASLIGILLSNTDRNDLLRAVVFAFVCGVFWRPVYEAGGAYIEKLPEAKQEAKAAAAAQALDEALVELAAAPARDPAAASRAVVEAGQATSALVAATGRLKDPEVRAQYQQRAALGVKAIARVDAPASQKVEVLADVSRQAAEQGQPEVAAEAVRGLDAAVAGSKDARLVERRDMTVEQLNGVAERRDDPVLQKRLDEARRRRPERPPG